MVPGDLVLLGPGDLLAADLRLTESWALRINEAALTSESGPVTKRVELLPEIDDSLLADRRNMACRGTAVTGGRGARVVVATGMATELGGARGLWQHALWVGLTMAAVCLALLVGRGRPVGHGRAWSSPPWRCCSSATLWRSGPSAKASSRSARGPTRSCWARSSGRWRSSLPSSMCRSCRGCLQGLLDTEALEPVQLAVVLAASTAAFVAVELQKWVIRRRSRRSHHSPACWPFCVAPDASRLLLGG